MNATPQTDGIRHVMRRRAIGAMISALCLLADGVALAQGRFEATKSPQGLAFHHREQAATPFAAVTFGMRDIFGLTTPGKEGFAALGAALVMQGADGGGQTEFSEQLRDLAATASISFGQFSTIGTVRAPGNTIAKSMGLMASALKSAQPTEKLVARLRQRAGGADAQAAQRAETIAQRAALHFALGSHPLTRGFDPDRFARVSGEDLASWRKATLVRSRLNIVVSGRISKNEAGRLVDASFADIPDDKSRPALEWPEVSLQAGTIVVEHDTTQSAIVLVGLTGLSTPREVERAIVANAVLGGSNGRLWQGVRAALGSTYGAGSGLQLVGPGKRIVTLRTAVDNDKVKATLEALRTVYATWRDKGVAADELRAVTSRLANDQRSALDDPARANGLVVAMRLAGRPVEDIYSYESRIRGVELAALNRFIAEKFPAPDQLITVIVTPRADGLGATCTIRSAEDAPRCRK